MITSEAHPSNTLINLTSIIRKCVDDLREYRFSKVAADYINNAEKSFETLHGEIMQQKQTTSILMEQLHQSQTQLMKVVGAALLTPGTTARGDTAAQDASLHVVSFLDTPVESSSDIESDVVGTKKDSANDQDGGVPSRVEKLLSSPEEDMEQKRNEEVLQGLHSELTMLVKENAELRVELDLLKDTTVRKSLLSQEKAKVEGFRKSNEILEGELRKLHGLLLVAQPTETMTVTDGVEQLGVESNSSFQKSPRSPHSLFHATPTRVRSSVELAATSSLEEGQRNQHYYQVISPMWASYIEQLRELEKQVQITACDENVVAQARDSVQETARLKVGYEELLKQLSDAKADAQAKTYANGVLTQQLTSLLIKKELSEAGNGEHAHQSFSPYSDFSSASKKEAPPPMRAADLGCFGSFAVPPTDKLRGHSYVASSLDSKNATSFNFNALCYDSVFELVERNVELTKQLWVMAQETVDRKEDGFFGSMEDPDLGGRYYHEESSESRVMGKKQKRSAAAPEDVDSGGYHPKKAKFELQQDRKPGGVVIKQLVDQSVQTSAFRELQSDKVLDQKGTNRLEDGQEEREAVDPSSAKLLPAFMSLTQLALECVPSAVHSTSSLGTNAVSSHMSSCLEAIQEAQKVVLQQEQYIIDLENRLEIVNQELLEQRDSATSISSKSNSNTTVLMEMTKQVQFLATQMEQLKKSTTRIAALLEATNNPGQRGNPSSPSTSSTNAVSSFKLMDALGKLNQLAETVLLQEKGLMNCVELAECHQREFLNTLMEQQEMAAAEGQQNVNPEATTTTTVVGPQPGGSKNEMGDQELRRASIGTGRSSGELRAGKQEITDLREALQEERKKGSQLQAALDEEKLSHLKQVEHVWQIEETNHRLELELQQLTHKIEHECVTQDAYDIVNNHRESLRGEIKALQATMAQLYSKMEEEQTETAKQMSNSVAETQSIQQQLQQKINMIQNQGSEIQRINQEKNEAQASLVTIKYDLNVVTHSLQDAKTQLNNKSQEIDKLKKEIEKQKGILLSQNCAQEYLRTLFPNQQEVWQVNRQRLQQVEGDASIMQENNMTLQVELQSVQNQLASVLQQQTEAEQKLVVLEGSRTAKLGMNLSENASASERLSRAEFAQQQLSNEVLALTREKDALKERESMQRQQLTVLASDPATAYVRKYGVKKTLDLDAQMAELYEKLLASESEHQSALCREKELLTEKQFLEGRFAAVKFEVSEKTKALNSSEQQLQEKANLLTSTQNELRKLKTKLEEHEACIQQKTVRISAVEQQVADLEKVKIDNENTIKTLTTNVETLKEQVAQGQSTVSTLRQEIAAGQTTCAQLRHQLSQVQGQHDQLFKDNFTLTESNEKLTALIGELQHRKVGATNVGGSGGTIAGTPRRGLSGLTPHSSSHPRGGGRTPQSAGIPTRSSGASGSIISGFKQN